ncbi:hypothetical protein HII36_33230 [Nonomuraea sp. NN258]|uniref:hypothetical protein n=1 Tax=Nonomuraea antri TaxID=2730852 RepID=UPI001568CD89|nr:hypothetical protein [Nonomuraea antri]NRQ36662.1 hypothetical protein [Nonomuraea antri]
MVAAGQDRANQRRGRIGKSVVKTPAAVYLAQTAALAVTPAGYAILVPPEGRAFHLVAPAAVAGVFAVILLLLHGMEPPVNGPFTGPADGDRVGERPHRRAVRGRAPGSAAAVRPRRPSSAIGDGGRDTSARSAALTAARRACAVRPR